ncbi:MAG: c-type cytochrome [Candidatus Limnocylindria bacterium]
MAARSIDGRRLGFAVGFVIAIALVGIAAAVLVSGPSTGPIATAGDPLAGRGEALYQANCASCHGGPTGGAMMDYPPRHNASGHTWHHPDCELREVILTGTSPMIEMMRDMMAPPGAPTMPAWRDRLGDDEVDAVLAYIKTMWTDQQRAAQEDATREACG